MGVQELRYQFWISYNPLGYFNKALKKLEKKYIFFEKKNNGTP